jgi:protein-L-isoaspartate O-methyltransferase
MTDLLGPEPHESILEVGTGLGYQAAVLAELSGRVWSVEGPHPGRAARGLRAKPPELGARQ